ncbi:EAL domain-containing protein [Halothiobacillus sp. 15-55-196]|uniref:EAL domain-containing protein n=1 Tax=Halothiobacillus sp. 15-55-196 TaxID=1970382 RepID=UPI0025C048F0|nr:EAL domain-containing protein [Halothiobacillus sp. 15-55-196]
MNHLIEIRPDVIKLDLNLIRDIDHDAGRQAVLRATVSMCKELGIGVVAEGVETLEEWLCLEDMGVFLHQGYLFSRPVFEALPEPQYP